MRTPRLLNGQNDGKGGIVFDSLSGWLLMRLKAVKEGLIIIKLETLQHKNHQGGWVRVESSELTEGWIEENNGIGNGMDETKHTKPLSTTSGVQAHRRLSDGCRTPPPWNEARDICRTII